jgi:hypothetical protein
VTCGSYRSHMILAPIKAPGVSRGIGSHDTRHPIAYAPGLYVPGDRMPANTIAHAPIKAPGVSRGTGSHDTRHPIAYAPGLYAPSPYKRVFLPNIGSVELMLGRPMSKIGVAAGL